MNYFNFLVPGRDNEAQGRKREETKRARRMVERHGLVGKKWRARQRRGIIRLRLKPERRRGREIDLEKLKKKSKSL